MDPWKYPEMVVSLLEKYWIHIIIGFIVLIGVYIWIGVTRPETTFALNTPMENLT